MFPKPSYCQTVLVVLFCSPATIFAANNSEGQSLGQAANDPTASLMSFQIQYINVGDYHLLDNQHGNTILLRSAIPFKTGDLKHIARATLPIITDSPSGKSGVGDLVLFDLMVSDQSWGRWGAGAVLLAPTAGKEELGSDKWAVGPALGFMARNKKLMWGIFKQNLFSFAGDDKRPDVDVSIVQPIVNYSLPNKWSVSLSDMSITYDWNRSGWSALPLGFKLSKLHKFSNFPVQFSGSYEYNFADDVVSPQWTINLTAKFLFPL